VRRACRHREPNLVACCPQWSFDTCVNYVGRVPQEDHTCVHEDVSRREPGHEGSASAGLQLNQGNRSEMFEAPLPELRQAMERARTVLLQSKSSNSGISRSSGQVGGGFF
jgi:hypothetical protein